MSIAIVIAITLSGRDLIETGIPGSTIGRCPHLTGSTFFAKSSGTNSAAISAVDTVNRLRFTSKKFIQPRM